jgi:uncharacterized protein
LSKQTKRKKGSTVRSVPRVRRKTPESDGPLFIPRGDRSQQKAQIHELTWMAFERQADALASAVRKAFRPEAVVGLLRGGIFVGAALARAFSCEFFPVRLGVRSRYSDNVIQTPRSFEQVSAKLVGKKILVVDDIASSGDLLELARTLALQAGAKQAKTATLVARKGGYAPDWSVIATEELVVFPWDYEPLVEDSRFDGGQVQKRKG